MNLLRLSRISIAVCLAGLLALTSVTAFSVHGLFQMQQAVQDMLQLNERIDNFSVASDGITMLGADPSVWRAYVAEGERLESALEALGAEYPDARKAARRVAVLVETVGLSVGVPGSNSQPDFLADATGSLALSPADRIVMHQVAGQGIALDTALDAALQERQQAIGRQVLVIGSTLALATLIFGTFCMVSFGLIHRRVARPARMLSSTLNRIGAGELGARAQVDGHDEMSELATALNQTLDERDLIDERLRERERRLNTTLTELGRLRDRLLRTQRIANLGGYDLDMDDGSIEWSDQALDILGVSRDAFGGTIEDFYALVHPADRERLRRARDAWIEAGRPGEFEERYRIVRPDGEQRWIEARAQSFRSVDGKIFSSGTLQDISARRALDERLQQIQQLVEGTEDLAGVVDESLEFVWVNPAYAAQYGLEPDEIRGIALRELVGQTYFDEEIQPRVKKCLAGEPQRFETLRALPGKDERHLLVRYYPITGIDGAVRFVGAVITDMTGEKEVERELTRRQQQLDMAGKMARFGAWTVHLDSSRVEWSDVVAEIHGKPAGYSPTVDEGIRFYAPEYRGMIETAFEECRSLGTPYDEELQIIDSTGARRWVRALGEAVRNERGVITRVQGAFQDISSAKALEEERRLLETRLGLMLESLTDAFVAVDDDWRIVFVNRHGARMIGEAKDDLIGEHLWTQFPTLMGTEFETTLRRAMDHRLPASLEAHFEPREAWLDLSAFPHENGIAALVRDVSDRHALVERLQKQERQLQSSHDRLRDALVNHEALINSLPAHVAMLDEDGTVVHVNDQWKRYAEQNDFVGEGFGVGRNYIAICGRAEGEFASDARRAGRGLSEVLSGARDNFSMEYDCPAPGRPQWFRMVANRLSGDGGNARGAVVMHVDVTERKLAETQLRQAAFQDPLSRTLSRNGFALSLQERLNEVEWDQESSVVMLDVIDQHDINDTHGYETGDAILSELGRRLIDHSGQSALIGRVGGDEFAIFLPGKGESDKQSPLEVIDAVIEQPFQSNDATGNIRVEVNVGFTRFGVHERSAEELMREAELALFEARRESNHQSGRVAYSTSIDERARERVLITAELREALESQQFELHFQPKVELDSGRMISAEALIRWHHPERGLQPPGLFIPVAEQSRLIGPIGDWALREACRRLTEWQDAELDVVRIAVNVSQVQFALGDFPAKVRRALDDHDVDPANLCLEITESVFEDQSDRLLRDMRELSDMGVRLSLDDFGTGYSSLLYLQRYPFDEIKIDRGFVDRLLDDEYSRNIVVTVMNLAQALDADVVAEGIESADIAKALVAMGCNAGQGFYYSVPLEAEDFRWLLDKRTPLPLQHSPDRYRSREKTMGQPDD